MIKKFDEFYEINESMTAVYVSLAIFGLVKAFEATHQDNLRRLKEYLEKDAIKLDNSERVNAYMNALEFLYSKVVEVSVESDFSNRLLSKVLKGYSNVSSIIDKVGVDRFIEITNEVLGKVDDEQFDNTETTKTQFSYWLNSDEAKDEILNYFTIFKKKRNKPTFSELKKVWKGEEI